MFSGRIRAEASFSTATGHLAPYPAAQDYLRYGDISPTILPRRYNSTMTYDDVVEGFRALGALDFDLSNLNGRGMERLYELTDAVMALPSPQRTIPELFALMERLSDSDLGSPGPLVHALEKLTGYEVELVLSVRRRPTPLSVWMVNRILNTELREERRTALLSLLETAALHPSASASVRDDAVDFLRLQRHKVAESR